MLWHTRPVKSAFGWIPSFIQNLKFISSKTSNHLRYHKKKKTPDNQLKTHSSWQQLQTMLFFLWYENGNHGSKSHSIVRVFFCVRVLNFPRSILKTKNNWILDFEIIWILILWSRRQIIPQRKSIVWSSWRMYFKLLLFRFQIVASNRKLQKLLSNFFMMYGLSLLRLYSGTKSNHSSCYGN